MEVIEKCDQTIATYIFTLNVNNNYSHSNDDYTGINAIRAVYMRKQTHLGLVFWDHG